MSLHGINHNECAAFTLARFSPATPNKERVDYYPMYSKEMEGLIVTNESDPDVCCVVVKPHSGWSIEVHGHQTLVYDDEQRCRVISTIDFEGDTFAVVVTYSKEV